MRHIVHQLQPYPRNRAMPSRHRDARFSLQTKGRERSDDDMLVSTEGKTINATSHFDPLPRSRPIPVAHSGKGDDISTRLAARAEEHTNSSTEANSA